MNTPSVDLREPSILGASSAFGSGIAASLAIPRAARAPSVTPDVTTSRSWWKVGARVLRNAALAVAVMALVPIGLVVWRGDDLARMLYSENINIATRAAAADGARSLRVPTDPSITPMQAGVALNALQPSEKRSPGFEPMEVGTRPVVAWQEQTLSPDMFLSSRPDLYSGPSSRYVLEAAAKGFSPKEREYLRVLATAPVWRDFDLVARAPAVDIIGGRFKIPFGPDARAEQRPLPSFKDSRELAYAAVSRAAYHMELGQRDSAEAVLRSIISFGFASIDNGSSAIEELIGGVIVGTGRDALHRFYVIEHDPRADLPALAAPVRTLAASPSAGAHLSGAEARRRLVARVENPSVPLSERFDGLQALSLTSCTNVRELLFGPRADVRDAIAKARATLARYPSEKALVDLETRMPFGIQDYATLHPVLGLAASSASVAGVVLHNPRLVSCALVLSAGR